MAVLDRVFALNERKTNVGREFRGAVATFLTMAYIIAVNPLILASAGIPQGPAIVCTALAAAISCIIMGLYANFPLALASGMGLNAVVAGLVTGPMHLSWQTAMGLIVLDGLVVLLLVLAGVREAIMNAIPKDLRLAIGAGIGLFIAFIGLSNAKLIVAPGIPGVPLSVGSLRDPAVLVFIAGFIITAFLFARRITGSLVIGMLLTTVLALIVKVTKLPDTFAMVSLSDFGLIGQADVRGALKLAYIPLLLAIIMVDFFDTLGTATAIAEEANLMDEKGRIPKLRQLLVADSVAASIGGLCGVSSVTCYIESAAGVAEGARTGLHTVFVGLFFLASILLAPLVMVIPAAATAPALVLVGFLMIAHMRNVDVNDWEAAIPAFVTFITIPLTYSIAHGIGFGFITYVLIKAFSLKFREVHPMMYISAAMMALYMYLEATRVGAV
jgi:adenine/guanine/hypoxanthine permease